MEEITVKDAMVPLGEYPAVAPDGTLYDAIVELDAARARPTEGKPEHRSVLVIDGNGKVVGKLTYVDLLQGLEPKYGEIGDVEGMGHFGLSSEFVTFMRSHFGLWEGSFRDLCQKALGAKIKDIAHAPGPDVLIDEGRPIADAVHQLILAGEVSLFVTREGEIVGLVRLIDAFDVMAQEIMACKL